MPERVSRVSQGSDRPSRPLAVSTCFKWCGSFFASTAGSFLTSAEAPVCNPLRSASHRLRNRLVIPQEGKWREVGSAPLSTVIFCGQPARGDDRRLDLLDRPRTCNENIHESLGALLPVGAGGDIRHADQGTQQVNRV